MDGLTFRVGSMNYTVELTKGLLDRYNFYGKVTYADGRIEVDADMHAIRQDNVLIHELTHAMLFEVGIEEQDEDLVNRLAHVLHGVLRDNDFGFIRKENGGDADE